MLDRIKYSPSAIISLVLALSIVVFRSLYPPDRILSWDVFGYYLYLPAAFIYHDLRLLDISWVNHLIEQYQTTSTFYQATALPAGGWVLKYSMGMAVLYAPGFFIAHLISSILGYTADGFSVPYQYAWAITGLVFSAIGIFVLRKILLEYFSDKLSTIVLIIIVLGTNYFQLTAFEGFLSHNFLFTIYTILVWLTILWHKTPKLKYAVGIGLAIGLATLTRPSEIVCVLVPLFWGIFNKESAKQKWSLLKSKFSHVLILLAAAFLMVLPQVLYWKYSTGHWIFYSYNNAGEGFEFTHPYLALVLFSFRKGWFIYTPIMAFAVLGFYWLFTRNRPIFFTVLVYFLVNLYIVSSWTCWWYAGGSYSQRALLSSYVLLALPLGYFIEWVQKRRSGSRITIFSIMSLLLLLNLFQTWQWAHGIIDRTRMTKEYYMAIFGRTSLSESDRKLLLVERPLDANAKLVNENEYNQRTIIDLNFEELNTNYPLSSDTVFEGKHALRLDEQHCFSPGLEIPFSQITSKDHAWIRAEVRVFPTAAITDQSASLVITFQHKKESYQYMAKSIALKEFDIKPGRWNLMKMDYLTPEVRSTSDICKVYFWLQGKNKVLIDNFKVDIFEPKAN